MSLKVWLPLNGDLNNQGLSNLTFQNVNATYTTDDASGKIGHCISTDAPSWNRGGLLSYETIDLGTKQSMFCWFKFKTLNSNSNLGAGIVTQHRTATFTGMGITIRYASSTTGYLSVNTGNGSARTYNYYYGTTLLQANTWYHGGYTYDGSKIRIYVNGVLEKEASFANMSTPADYIGVGIWQMSGSSGRNAYQYYVLNGSVNDVRVYDHALSAKEVKEIAKGLILHYKLDDPYVEGTTNLITSADGLSNTCYNGATNKYSYGTSTDMYKEVTTWQGRTGTRVHMGTNGLDAYPYVYFDPFNPTGTDYRTLSFDYYPTIQTSLVPYSYNGSYDWDCRVNGIRSTASNSNSITLNGVRMNAWNHIEITAHRHDEGTARGTGYVRIGSAKHTSNVSNFWFFSNIQVELKDHATPYTLYNTTRAASTTVHDCSGYKHNGTPYNLLIASANKTSRYSASTYIQSGNTDYLVTNSTIGNPSDAITMSIWFRSTSTSPGSSYHEIFNHATSNQAFEFAIHSTGYFRQGMLVNGTRYVINGGTGLLDGTWHMLSATYDGTEIKRYIDGVLVSSMTQTIAGTLNGANGRFLMGHCGSNTSYYAKYAYVSDARIYATALSADDILELYQTSASVDKSGNVYARELVEV